MLNKLWISPLIVIFLSTAQAHQDRFFNILPDGTLKDVPENFGPVQLKIGNWYTDTKKEKNKSSEVLFRIGKKQIQIPPCIASRILESSKEKIRATGSWYHDLTLLPPYLSIRLPTKSEGQAYKLLFDLEKAKLLELEKEFTVKDSLSIQSVKLADICSEAELKKLIPTDVKK